MYVISKRAAVWNGPAAARQRATRPERVQRWAERPLQTPHGVARAIRFVGEDARVLVEHDGRRHWVPIDLAMNDAQARRWIKTGFGRGA